MTGPHAGHPLAGLAAARCAREHGPAPDEGACFGCWEAVIRAAATLAAECGLPPEPPEWDALLVDEVAVDRACAGETDVVLTEWETALALARLALTCTGPTAMHRRLAGRVGMPTATRAWHAARTTDIRVGAA